MLSAFVLASVAVAVEGDTSCPSASRVREVLAPLLEGTEPRLEPHRVQLSEQRDGIAVELSSGPDRRLAERTFPRGASCEDLASVIAVVIATWETELAGEVAMRIEEPARTPRSTRTFEIGIGALGARDTTFGGFAEAAIGRGSWGLRLAVAATVARHTELAPGRVRWSRDALLVGVRRRIVGSPSLSLDGSVDAVFGVLVARGEGFTENRTSYSSAPAIAPALRGTLRQGRFGWFVEVSDWIWLRRGRLEVAGINATPDLPRHDLRIAAGIGIWFGNR